MPQQLLYLNDKMNVLCMDTQISTPTHTNEAQHPHTHPTQIRNTIFHVRTPSHREHLKRVHNPQIIHQTPQE